MHIKLCRMNRFDKSRLLRVAIYLCTVWFFTTPVRSLKFFKKMMIAVKSYWNGHWCVFLILLRHKIHPSSSLLLKNLSNYIVNIISHCEESHGSTEIWRSTRFHTPKKISKNHVFDENLRLRLLPRRDHFLNSKFKRTVRFGFYVSDLDLLMRLKVPRILRSRKKRLCN